MNKIKIKRSYHPKYVSLYVLKDLDTNKYVKIFGTRSSSKPILLGFGFGNSPSCYVKHYQENRANIVLRVRKFIKANNIKNSKLSAIKIVPDQNNYSESIRNKIKEFLNT